VPGPCHRAAIAAQARARCRAVLGTGTRQAVPGRFRIGLFRDVPVPARKIWPVWKSIAILPLYLI